MDSYLMGACAMKVAKQQGEYVAKLLASGKAQPGKPIQGAKPFRSICLPYFPKHCLLQELCLFWLEGLQRHMLAGLYQACNQSQLLKT